MRGCSPIIGTECTSRIGLNAEDNNVDRTDVALLRDTRQMEARHLGTSCAQHSAKQGLSNTAVASTNQQFFTSPPHSSFLFDPRPQLRPRAL
jgi:hypothetical protein